MWKPVSLKRVPGKQHRVAAVKVDFVTRDNKVVDPEAQRAVRRGPEAEKKSERMRKKCGKAFNPEKRASHS